MNDHIEQPVQHDDLLVHILDASRAVTELTAADQLALANWYFKAAFIENSPLRSDEFPLQQLAGTYPYPLAIRKRFLADGRPMPSVTVWLGQTVSVSKLKPWPPKSGEATHRLDKLVLSPWHRVTTPATYRTYPIVLTQPLNFFRPVDLPPVLSDHLVRIWPTSQEPVSWPPKLIDRAMLVEMGAMFEETTAPVRPFWRKVPPKPDG